MADLNAALEWAKNNPNDERSKKLLDAVSKGKITSDSVKAKSIQQSVKQEEPGYMQSLVSSAEKRADTVGGILASKQSPFSKAAQVFGQGAGLGADIIGGGISKIASAVTPEFIEKPVKELASSAVSSALNTDTAKNIIRSYEKFKQENPEKAGNVEAFLNTINLGAQLTPAGSVTKGAGSLAGKVASKAGEAVAKTAGGIGDIGGFAVRQGTGLSGSTIGQIIKTPELFSSKELAKITKESVVDKVKSAVERRLSKLSETGKAYEGIRTGTQAVDIPEGTIENVLSKYGLVVKDGKIIRTAESVPLKSGDISAIEDFISQYGDARLSGNAFINARMALSNMKEYDITKSSISKTIARQLRYEYDQLGKSALKGLKELDEKYAPEAKLLGGLKKQLFDADGTLKQGAIQKIANLTGPGKEKILESLKKVVPGIETDVNILKSLRDIDAVNNQKVGAYVSGALKSGVAGAVVSGGNPIIALGAAILASPQVAVPIIRGYAKTMKVANSVIEPIIGKMRGGIKLAKEEVNIVDSAIRNASSKMEERIKKGASDVIDKTKNLPAGMSIKDVSGGKAGYSSTIEKKYFESPRKLKQSVLAVLSDFTDYVYGNPMTKKAAVQTEIQARKIAEGIGLNPEVSNEKLAEKFTKILERHNFKIK